MLRRRHRRLSQVRFLSGAPWILLVPGGLAAVGHADNAAGKPEAHAWHIFASQSGLPPGPVYSVCITDEAVWAGTPTGAFRLPLELADRPDARWTPAVPPDRLAHPATTAIAFDPLTGDMWLGSLAGLTHYSAGRTRIFRQTNSGLANDVVYDLLVHRNELWVATSAGCSRYSITRDQWDIYTNLNAPVDRMWPRGLAAWGDFVFLAGRGSGLLRYDVESQSWLGWTDPDGWTGLDMERNDGPVDDFATAVACQKDGKVWLGTRLGLCRFADRRWTCFSQFDSPLPDDRITALECCNGWTWVGTEHGLAATDGHEWHVMPASDDKDEPAVVHIEDDGAARAFAVTNAPPAGAVFDLAADAAGIWVATESGLARGVAERESAANTAAQPAMNNRTLERPMLVETVGPWRYETPYRRFFARPVEPARATVIQTSVARPEKIRIGLVIPPPGTADADLGRSIIEGATLAVEGFNVGLNGVAPAAELIPRSAADHWGSAANQVVPLVRDSGCSALLAPPGSVDAHLADELAGRLRVPTVISAAGDPRLSETNSAWTFRVVADDRRQSFALAYHLVAELGLNSIAVFRTADDFGQIGASAFRQALYHMGLAPTAELQWQPGSAVVDPQLRQFIQLASQAVVVWGNPRDAAGIVRHIHEHRLGLRVFGCARLAEQEFLDLAGPAAEGVTVAATWNPTDPAPATTHFVREHTARFGRAPDTAAAHAYDATRFILDAARRAGPNPRRLRDEMARTSSHPGVTGTILFDTTNNDAGLLWLATVTQGRFVYRPIDLAGLPRWTPGRVMQAALDFRRLRSPSAVPVHTGRPRPLRIGCIIPHTESGNLFAYGAETAVMSRPNNASAPLVSLRVQRIRGDWGRTASAMLDLALEDDAAAMLALVDPDSAEQLARLADTSSIPVLLVPAGGFTNQPRDDQWTLWLAPAAAEPQPGIDPGRPADERLSDQDARSGFNAASRILRAINAGARTRWQIRDQLHESAAPSARVPSE